MIGVVNAARSYNQNDIVIKKLRGKNRGETGIRYPSNPVIARVSRFRVERKVRLEGCKMCASVLQEITISDRHPSRTSVAYLLHSSTVIKKQLRFTINPRNALFLGFIIANFQFDFSILIYPINLSIWTSIRDYGKIYLTMLRMKTKCTKK